MMENKRIEEMAEGSHFIDRPASGTFLRAFLTGFTLSSIYISMFVFKIYVCILEVFILIDIIVTLMTTMIKHFKRISRIFYFFL